MCPIYDLRNKPQLPDYLNINDQTSGSSATGSFLSVSIRSSLRKSNLIRILILDLLALLVLFSGCKPEKDEEVKPGLTLPSDIETILAKNHLDPANDQVIAPQEGPPVVFQYPPSDLVSVKLGVSGSVLYMRVTFAGVIPSGPFAIPAQGIFPMQVVKDQGMSLNMNIDNDLKTGAAGSPVMNGIDVFYGVKFVYGDYSTAYVNYDFPGNDVHLNRGHLEGSFLEGGPGFDHVTVGFDISGLSSFFPRGRSVVIGAWSEAQSFRTDGSLLYHHFAFDPTTAENWTIPQ